jgi:N-acyl-D-amino-acid deacylase
VLDLLIQGGTVIDGSGAPRFDADVAVQAGRIVAIGLPLELPARRRIDARGLVVAPGFIDCHTHDDTAVTAHDAIRPKLLQGVTTVIAGNCGLSAAPLTRHEVPPPLDILDRRGFGHADFGAFLDAVQAAGPYVNCGFLVGHTTLRVQTMKALDRPANEREIAAMRELLDAALAAGALGASIGTYYPPAAAADAYEIVAVCRPLRPDRHMLAVHLRDEGDHVLEAIDEALAIATQLGVPLVISHHKLAGVANHGRSRETLERLAGAARLQPVCLDCYPYEASSTMLSAANAEVASRVTVAWSQPYSEFAGRDLDEIAAELGIGRGAAARLASPGGGIYFTMDPRDVRAIASHPLAMIGSDGLPHDRHPHPRLWGTFPRLLGRLARDEGWFPLETAVHKATGLTAQRFGLHGRGRVAAGAAADLVLFDPLQLIDAATYEQPTLPPVGIATVIINGVAVVEAGEIAALPHGQVLRADT